MKGKRWLIVYCICLLCAVLVRKPFVQALSVMSDQTLHGIKVVIDAGHGGNDPGARINGQDEDEINLDLAEKLASILEKAGAEVEMTRTGDVNLADDGAENIKRSDMKHRAEILNQKDVTLFVSLHCNTSADQRCKGSQVYYRKSDDHSRRLADAIQNRLGPATGSKYIPASGDFYLLNETETCGVLVEAGFMTNAEDAQKLNKESYREEIAYEIYRGIHDFLKILL